MRVNKKFWSRLNDWIFEDGISELQEFSRFMWALLFGVGAFCAAFIVIVMAWDALYRTSPTLTVVGFFVILVLALARWTYSVFHYTKDDDE